MSTSMDVARRRAVVARLYGEGMSPREIVHHLSERYGIKVTDSTVRADIAKVREAWQRVLTKTESMHDPLDEYIRRNRHLRHMLLERCTVGVKCPHCGGEVQVPDVRAFKLVADLDKDLAKVEGAYSDRVVVTVEEARGMVQRVLEAVEQHAPTEVARRILDAVADMEDV